MASANSVYDAFRESVERFPQNSFLHVVPSVADIYDLAVTDYTYAEASTQVEEFARTYRALGYGRGMRVGVAFENRPMHFLQFLALNALGISILPLNPGLAPEELQYQVTHGECDFLVVDASLQNKMQDALVGAHNCPVVTPDALMSLPVREDSAQAVTLITRETEAALLYTSGTTGQPKGCILSNEYFLAIGDLYRNLGGQCTLADGAERLITPLPVTHMNALACSFMVMVVSGGCLVQMDRFHPRSWWDNVRQSEATIMHYLGVMPAMLLNFPENDDEDFSQQIKFAFGAGCDPKHHAVFEKRFGIQLIEAWAMTETGAGAWITANNEQRHVGERCFGLAPKGLEYKLIGEEGEDLRNGVPGELLVRRAGENPRQYFFGGYFKDDAATEAAWQGGYFHTGDVVRVDEDGYFYFVDRRKNVIRRSGENISAIEVESVLMRHELVDSCVVVPVPDEFRGDEVMALVVLSEQAGQDKHKAAEQVFKYTMQNLIYFKTPGFIAFVHALPMTASEKVKRGDAKIMAKQLVVSGQCFDFCALKKRPKQEQSA